MPRPVHFELSADQPERAVRFYAEAFGWTFTKWEGPMEYWLVSTGPAGQPGIDGGLMRRQAPGATTVNVIDVASADAALARVQACGGRTVAPKMHIPGVGHVAYCTDTEGNAFGIIEAETGL